MARGRLLLLAFIGIAGFTIVVWPHVQILPSNEGIDASEFHVFPFTFRNTGYLPLYDLEIQCDPQNVVLINAELNAVIEQNGSIGGTRTIAEKVTPGGDKPFNCEGFDIGAGIQLSAAEMLVLVRLKPIPFMPTWPTISRFFVTSRQSDGKLRWEERAAPH